MENLTHSHSKKSYSGDGFGMATHKSVYDDVFGGPPKFGVPTLAPRFEDYSEIFGGFHSSRGLSIPILDLPVVDQAELSWDFRSSTFDYSEVFGGSEGLDSALSFQDLVRKSNGGDNSSDDAWSPAQSESLSDESDPSIFSERNQSLPNADTHHLLGDVRQFNVSYHKANQISSKKKWNSEALVTQSHVIPGQSHRINQNHASQNVEDEGTSLLVSGNHNSHSHSVGRIGKERRFKKSLSLPKTSGFGMHGSDLCYMEKHRGPAFDQNEPFVTVCGISLRTKPSRLPPPSRPPPAFAAKKGDPVKPNPKLRASNSFASKWTADDSSVTFHDVEIDATSSKMASSAMPIAIEKAQANIRSAKEPIGNEVQQTCLKLQAQDSIKTMEEKVRNIANGSDIHKDDKMQGTCDKEGISMQPLAEERKKVIKITVESSDLVDGEKYIDLAEKPTERMHGKESRSVYHVSHKSAGNFAWRQETEYFEVVETGTPLKAVEPGKNENNLSSSVGSDEHRHGIKAATESSEEEEVIMQFKAVKQTPKLEEKKMVKENFECSYNRIISEITVESSFQKECQKKVEVDTKKMKRAKQSGEIKKLQNDACKIVENLEKSERNGSEAEVKQKLRAFSGRRDLDTVLIDGKVNERSARENFRTEECDKRLEGDVHEVVSEKREIKQEERKKQEESHEKEVNKKKQQEVCQRKENEILKKAIEQEDHVKKFKGTVEGKKGDNNLKRTCEQEENERDRKQNCEREETKRTVMNEGQFKTHVRQDCEEKSSDGCETGEADVRFTEVWKQVRDKNTLAADYVDEDMKESSCLTSGSEESMHVGEHASRHQILSRQTKGSEQINRDGNDRMRNSDQGIHEIIKGENVKAFDGPHRPDDNMHAMFLSGELFNNLRGLEPTQADISREKGQKLETELKDAEQDLEVRAADCPVEERLHSFGKHEKDNIQTEDVIKSRSLCHHVIDPNADGIDIRNSCTKLDKNVSQVAYDPENMNVNTHEQAQRGKMMNGVQITSSQEITKDKSMSHQASVEWAENGKKIGAPLSAVHEKRRNTLNPDQRCTSQHSERNLHETLAPKEQKTDERLQHNMKLEKEHLRRIEEEEREREREKDRMAVNRATLEARDKSYSEARERAERTAVGRATADVRQRAMAETRERLEKASIEARERSLADKESMEARLRAERAAVERATAEARQRAFEKAMAEKASSEARERVERSVPDKFSFSSRNAEVRQSSSSSDLPSHSSGTSNLFQYSYSSTHAGVDGESPQRSQARLERYRRTAERAAKALAEKNMRDLLAQREQAERNRLAETLDAEVKRWSSGKEGNLRALLSTLQYILGPDSGWQPIPLTEVITTAAVKKAYRKATLCVHPDKLQQRSASIQHKYICEKVFDLLKEAWNTFNSEER